MDETRSLDSRIVFSRVRSESGEGGDFGNGGSVKSNGMLMWRDV